MKRAEGGAASASPERERIAEILQALEFGTPKEEQPLLDAVLDRLSVPRAASLEDQASEIARFSGFQPFLLEVLGEVRPFALMLREIYGFLNDSGVFARRRASVFRVSSAAAAEKLEFSLDSFPRELLSVLSRVDFKVEAIELRLPGLSFAGGAPRWHDSAASEAWRAVSPNWDGDFYDHGFHRALSYAPSVLGADPEAWHELEAVVEPILDRLAAIVRHADAIRALELGEEVSLPPRDPPRTFRPTLPEARAARVQSEAGGSILEREVLSGWRSDDDERSTVLHQLRWSFYGMAIAVHLFRNEKILRDDREAGKPPPGTSAAPESPASYLGRLKGLAAEYRLALDRVAPVVSEHFETRLDERLIEFLLLPFWKNRWFLYELWTLVLVLREAERVASVELLLLEEAGDGVVEWMLPGGKAGEPVAAIGDGAARVLVWTQRQTYHPGSGAQLEPDLRLTAQEPQYHDLLVIENKDRRKPPTGDMAEIIDRYLGGTCARGLWMVNYDHFKGGLEGLAEKYPERRLGIVSEFRPGQVPAEFLANVIETLTEHLGARPRTSVAPAGPPEASLREDLLIELRWGETPRDLDLYVRVVRTDGAFQLSFREQGALDRSPFAQMSSDVRYGNGCETVRVLPEGLQRVEVSVHNFSGEPSLATSGARLTARGFHGLQLDLPVPLAGSGRWWHCLSLDALAKSAQISGWIDDSGPGEI